MLKIATISLLLCYGFLLSGSMFSIAHGILHATSSFTGIHQHQKHEVKHKHAHSHGHGHTHQVYDHGSFFKNLPSFTKESKEIFCAMAFLMFYYHPTYQIQKLSFELTEDKASLYLGINSMYKNSLLTPPPDYLLFQKKQL